MKRFLVMLLVLIAVIQGIVGIASAEHGGGIDPFSSKVQVKRVAR